ncbi:MAG: HlyD family secretion protein [Rhodopila sp.]|nr:HlyD family secretion protein [Rhodopila sp.]
MKFLSAFGRLSVTAIALFVAVLVGRQVWFYYVDAPWTRDGRVSADVVGVAPDVSGLVAEVLVHDEQTVHRGDVLLRIDPARFQIAVDQAESVVANRKATLDQAVRDFNRYRQLDTLSTSKQKQEQTAADMQAASASYRQALADYHLAQLNLERSEVKASVNGIVTNMDLQPGDYVSAGKGVFALVDTDTLRVEGYFEETKLSRVAVGDPVTVRLMGQQTELHGHVHSIAAGIADRERSASEDMLANVNPTFTWVRLAQRVPVRVLLDDVPEGLPLVIGRTATVIVRNASMPKPLNLLSWLGPRLG